MDKAELLKVEGLTKEYPGVTALNNVDFTLYKGEVNALIGENGAGKSTFIKSLMGIVHPDKGKIWIEGKAADISSPEDAAKHGIAAVFQELSLIPHLTVGENTFLNKEGKQAKVFLNRKSLYEKTNAILEKYNIEGIRADDLISDLSPAQKQLAEIVKAIVIQPRLLILDEPTSSLTEKETDVLFRIIRKLKEEQAGIIYISHRMQELEIIADRVTVLRDGGYIGSSEIKDVTMNEIIQMMVGREIELHATHAERKIDRTEEKRVLKVRHICKKGSYNDVSFDLYRGEILGIAGLVGSGRSELMQILFGIEQADSGEIYIEGKKANIKSVQDALKYGIAMVPESRHQQGLVLIHTIADNIALPKIREFQKRIFLNHRKLNHFALQMIQKYKVKTESPYKLAGELSGGNQQKVVIAKWMATNPKILIIDEPTVGIDIHAKTEIHKMLKNMADSGVSIIMISSEMTELLSNSDRVLVMNDYKILGTFKHISQERIMSMIMEDKNNCTKGGNR